MIRFLRASLILGMAGVLSASRAAETPAEASLQAGLDAAIRAGRPEFTLPGGLVRVSDGLRIQNATNLVISGPDTTLVFANQKGFGLAFSRCRDLVLRGVTIDFDPLPFTQGTVTATASDGSWCEFAVHAGYPDLSEAYLVKHVHVFEPDRVRWKESAPDLYPRRVIALDSRHGRLELGPKPTASGAVEAGDRIVLNARDGGAVSFRTCENVRVEGVTILAGPGCGVICRYMRGDNRFSYDIRPGPPPPGATAPRLMSTCADGFNYAFARRGPEVRNCHFSFMGDDSVNLHGFTLLVAHVVSPTELLVGWPHAAESVEWTVEPGDTARLLKSGTYAVAGRAALDSLTATPPPSSAVTGRIAAFWPREKGKRQTVFRLKLRTPLPASVGDAIDLPGSAAPHYVIADCDFQDHRARGTRIQSSHGVIENNLFRRLKMAAVSLGPEYVFWRESGWVEDVVVRNNRIEDCARSPDNVRETCRTLGAISVFGAKEDVKSAEPFASENGLIRVENNRIDGSAVAGIWMRCARDVAVLSNRISRVNLLPSARAGAATGFAVQGPIDVRGVPEAAVRDNQAAPNEPPP